MFIHDRKVLIGFVWGLFLFWALALASVAGASTTVQSDKTVPKLNAGEFIKFYPDGLYFEIRQNGKPIGFHKAHALFEKGQLVIENHTLMNARAFLSLIPYKLDYRSRSVWDGKQFISYHGEVEEQGNKTRISLEYQGKELVLKANEKETRVKGIVYPSPQWLSVYIDGQGLLDGMTGEIVDVNYHPIATKRVQTMHDWVEARKFKVEGEDIEALEWYDPNQRWIAMSFEAPDGSQVDYVCIICGQSDQGLNVGGKTSFKVDFKSLEGYAISKNRLEDNNDKM